MVVGAAVLLFAVALPFVRPRVPMVLRPIVLAILFLQLAAIILTRLKTR